MAGVADLVWVQIFVFPIISVWEFLSKNLGLWFLLFFSVYCGLSFRWDANMIYSAWHDAVRENWTLQGNANLSKEGLRVSNMFLWVAKEQYSMVYGETGE